MYHDDVSILYYDVKSTTKFFDSSNWCSTLQIIEDASNLLMEIMWKTRIGNSRFKTENFTADCDANYQNSLTASTAESRTIFCTIVGFLSIAIFVYDKFE